MKLYEKRFIDRGRKAFVAGQSLPSGLFITIMIFYENVFIAANRKPPGARPMEEIGLTQ
jgi:hypothetical protein